MPAGRKKLYDPNTFPLLAEQFAREGLTDKDIAKKLGISKTSFYDFQNEFPEFSEAVKRGKAPVDVMVENALFKRAIGFEFEETHTEVKLNPDGSGQTTSLRKVKKYFPGEVGAQVFWLANRKPDVWKNRQDKNITGKISVLDLSDDDDEIDK